MVGLAKAKIVFGVSGSIAGAPAADEVSDQCDVLRQNTGNERQSKKNKRNELRGVWEQTPEGTKCLMRAHLGLHVSQDTSVIEYPRY